MEEKHTLTPIPGNRKEAKMLTVIPNAFGLKRTGSIPTTMEKLHELLEADLKLLEKVAIVRRRYDT